MFFDNRYSSISGGCCNLIKDCSSYSFISSGVSNVINDNSCYSSINSGKENTLIDNSCYSSINAGYLNTITNTSQFSSIVGGKQNIINDKDISFIIGGNITADRDCTTFVNNLSITDIPTSDVGLPSGSIWRDGVNLKIVP